MYRLFNGTIYISVIFAYVNNITNCWFSHDVTKIQTKKLSILPRFYFHDALEQLKTNFHTNFRFKRVLGFVKNQNSVTGVCWFPSAMFQLIQVSTSMASPYKSLQVWVKHFFGYLVYKISVWPESWRGSLYMYLLSFPRFWTLSIERFWFLF